MHGENAGDDLREGKMTLPLILALEAANPAEREILVAALGARDVKATALAQVVSIMERHGTLERTLEKARRHVRLAREALARLPDSSMKTLLSDIAEFYVARAY